MLGLKAALFICVGLMVMLAGDVKASEASRQNYEADERAFFASAEVEKAERSTLARSLALATGDLKASDASMRFARFEDLFGKCLRHHSYYELLSSRNTSDASSRQALSEVDGLCEEASTQARGVLLSSSPKKHGQSPMLSSDSVPSTRAITSQQRTRWRPLRRRLTKWINCLDSMPPYSKQRRSRPSRRTEGGCTLFSTTRH